MTKLRVWDLPTRLFHWALAVVVVALVVTAKVGGAWMDWHLVLGHVALALLAFRLIWGFVGGHWSRFATFVKGPAAIWRQWRAPGATVGHSPLAALSVVAMLLVLAVQVGSGLMTDDAIFHAGPLVNQVPSEWVDLASSYHKAWGQWLVVGLVVLHLLAIVYYTRVKRQTLVRPMFTGDVPVEAALPPSRDGWAQRGVALVLAVGCTAVAVWVHRLGAAAF